MQDDLGFGGEGMLLDLPALAQPFACRSKTCAPSLRPARTRSCCADLVVELTPTEGDRIAAALPEVAAWMRPRDTRWQSVPAILDGDLLVRSGGRCVFAAQDRHGLTCALHAVEDATGRPRGALKPMPCRLFPLVLVDLGEDRVLLTAVTRHTARRVGLPPPASFPCLRGDTTRTAPLARNVRDTIRELWGEEIWGAVRRSVAAWRRRTRS
jgi:hypothetical protein